MYVYENQTTIITATFTGKSEIKMCWQQNISKEPKVKVLIL